jgi:hypothetical protein
VHTLYITERENTAARKSLLRSYHRTAATARISQHRSLSKDGLASEGEAAADARGELGGAAARSPVQIDARVCVHVCILERR